MQKHTLRARLAKVAAVAAVASVGAAAVMASASVAGADPKQFEDPLVGVGSDTTQDILDAFTGEVNGTRFIPLRSGPASGRAQLASWRAVQEDAGGSPVACIQPSGGILVDRPNGSGNGRRALSAAIGPASQRGWGRSDVGCTTVRANMSGLVDFARSSSGASATSGPLTFVPFARDALQWAYSAPDAASAVSDLTTAQVRQLHVTGGTSQVLNVGGTRIIACRIQSGSGTYESWHEDMFPGDSPPPDSGNVTLLNQSTAECAGAFDAVQQGINGIQEHDPQGLYDVCERIRNGYTPVGGGSAVAAQPNTQCIIGYSAANWVAQFNGLGTRSLDVDGAGTDAPPVANTGGAFNLGTQNGGAAAYTISGSTASPNPTYYADTTFGRDVFNVIPTVAITEPGFEATREMFLTGFDSEGPGSGPAMCTAAAATTRSLLGFAAPSQACGFYSATANKRAYDTACLGTVGSAETAC
ncbi:MAG: hypothetical protein ACOYXM_11415 [Actinomycetota bacterium]